MQLQLLGGVSMHLPTAKIVTHREYNEWRKKFIERNITSLKKTDDVREYLNAQDKILRQAQPSTTPISKAPIKLMKRSEHWKFKNLFSKSTDKSDSPSAMVEKPKPDAIHLMLAAQIRTELKSSLEQINKIIFEMNDKLKSKKFSDIQYEMATARKDLENYMEYLSKLDKDNYQEVILTYVQILLKPHIEFNQYIEGSLPKEFPKGTNNHNFAAEQARIQALGTEGLSILCDVLNDSHPILTSIMNVIQENIKEFEEPNEPECLGSLEEYIDPEEEIFNRILSIANPKPEPGLKLHKSPSKSCLRNSVSSLDLSHLPPASSQPSSTDTESSSHSLLFSPSSTDSTPSPANTKKAHHSRSATPSTNSKNENLSEPGTPVSRMSRNSKSMSKSVLFLEEVLEYDQNNHSTTGTLKTNEKKSYFDEYLDRDDEEDNEDTTARQVVSRIRISTGGT